MAAATIFDQLGAKQFQGLFDVITFEASIDTTSLADGAGATSQVTGVTGAALGDFVLVSLPVDAVDLIVTAYVQAAGVVEVRTQNEAGAARDTGPVTAKFVVLHPKF